MVVTAVRAHRQLRAGSEGQMQQPRVGKEEEEYLTATGQASDAQREQARPRLREVLHDMEEQLADKKRTAIVVERGAQ